jgi:hypothetical protein
MNNAEGDALPDEAILVSLTRRKKFQNLWLSQDLKPEDS